MNGQVRPRIDEVPTLTEVIGFAEAAAVAGGVATESDAPSPRWGPAVSPAAAPVAATVAASSLSAVSQLSATLLDGLTHLSPLGASTPAAATSSAGAAADSRPEPAADRTLTLSELADPAVPLDGWMAVAETQITQQVLTDVQRQVDRMFEYRVREVLGPVLARLTDQFIEDARRELATTLRDVVRRAVAQELSRLRGR